MDFQFVSKFKPTGDQPRAIKQLTGWLSEGERHQTLLGVTGSGKTYTMAKVIAELNAPTLVISPNKTLAAQLYGEFQQFFPNNAVHYFVSYYDYYQPEAYMPQTDTYIAKESMVNDEIDRLRHAATQSLLTRNDVIIVASVSCIYGLGSPENYKALALTINVGQKVTRQQLLRSLVGLQYDRNDLDFKRGSFRVRGERVEVHPITGDDIIRLEWDANTLISIMLVQNELGQGPNTPKRPAEPMSSVDIYPAKHFVTPVDSQVDAITSIRKELVERLTIMRAEGRELEAQRLEQRTNYDLELIETLGYCNGIENYSRHFDGRKNGEPPFTLIDYFRHASAERNGIRWLTFIDESHITLPQIRGMYAGDFSRKQMLVDYGWRLPSAFDNRPLNAPEFNERVTQLCYVSATPNENELKLSGAKNGLRDLQRDHGQGLPPEIRVAEQLIRPTGILDPEVSVRPSEGQLFDLVSEIKKRVAKGQRTLVTTITKKLSEALTEYLEEAGIKVQYLHSDVETLERISILKDLRSGIYDVLVGINLLREGLDLPEVSLVAILDADKEGFLRNETTLIQTMGRAARHLEGQVIMYADNMTISMKRAIAEVERRRIIQAAHNKKHGLVPHAIERATEGGVLDTVAMRMPEDEVVDKKEKKSYRGRKKK